jgi:hypothetical protein
VIITTSAHQHISTSPHHQINPMQLRFPLPDVEIEISDSKKEVQSPLFEDDHQRVNQKEYSLNVEDVANFYVSEGNHIFIFPYPNAAKNSLELYLNGSAYGAILHQRNILPLHGSCFNWNNKGIMLCGESGAGKSSLTASFCLKGAEFLTDDVTPVLFTNGKPQIWVMSDRIKLWNDSLDQLNHNKDGLHRIDAETEKFYFPMESEKGKLFPLNQLFLLSIHDKPEVEFQEISGVDKFEALKDEIYRLEYLQGMPDTASVYFKQLVNIARAVKITKVSRPEGISIENLRKELEKNIF